MTSGAGLSRNQIHIDMMGRDGICTLNGVNMLDASEHADTTITVDHRAPHCQSNQNYRNVTTDKSTAVFQGKVHVHQIAQKTDGYQMCKSLLLSPQSTIQTKPELEIYADDVKCSHGATTGRLDEKAMFYLRSRGIGEKAAQNLLIQAFVNEVIEDLSNEQVREQAEVIINSWLNRLDKAKEIEFGDD
jgi:Fe-S cluster assembly protein SufD